MNEQNTYVVGLADVGADDVGAVGGKNASLGEMIQKLGAAGVRVPGGFATTARAYRAFLDANGLVEPMAGVLDRLKRDEITLAVAGRTIRDMMLAAELPRPMADAIVRAYRELWRAGGRRALDVAVRSSATAEDLPQASFAGQQETFLNVRGDKDLLEACRRCLASLVTDRAIAYRETHGFDHMRVALSIGVQPTVRADRGAAGVMFTIDTETGFPRAVQISANWGLGETVVQGSVDPDEYVVFKPLLRETGVTPIIYRRRETKARKLVYAARGARPTRLVRTSRREQVGRVLDDADILQLARWAVMVEEHYGRPMDLEWAKDGLTGEPSSSRPGPRPSRRREAGTLRTYTVKARGERLLRGVAIGEMVATGPVCRLRRAAEIGKFQDGAILVTSMTDPDWVPIMKRAAAIITDHGGRTSHAAIVSRELGLPALVGTGTATQVLRDGREITVSCAEGDQGAVYDGIAEVEVRELALEAIPATRTKVMLNLANPAAAFRWWRLPADGVGLARIEIHRREPRQDPSDGARPPGGRPGRGRPPGDSFADAGVDGPGGLLRGHDGGGHRAHRGRLSPASRDRPAERLQDQRVRTADRRPLVRARRGEPDARWRGASRYASEGYREGFALECRALRKVREEIGLTNVVVMIPFCRTLEEADRTLAVMEEHGLRRGEHGLEVDVMCEIPSNVILAEAFAERFDGFSIGSNDLTQFTLGVDRDSAALAHLFDEENEAVRRLIQQVIRDAHAHGRKVGLCGQAPSDRPRFARFLVEAGIDSISVTPDSFLRVKEHVVQAEAALEAA